MGGHNPQAHQKWLKVIVSTIDGSGGGGGGGSSGNGTKWTSLFLKKTYIRDLKMKINNSCILEALNKWYTLYMHIYSHKVDVYLSQIAMIFQCNYSINTKMFYRSIACLHSI